MNKSSAMRRTMMKRMLASLFLLMITFSLVSCSKPKGAVEIKFDQADWNLEGHPAVRTARLGKGTGMIALRLQAISDSGWTGDVLVEGNFPAGVKYELIPQELHLNPNEKRDFVLRIGAEANVLEDRVQLKFKDKQSNVIAEAVVLLQGPPQAINKISPDTIKFREFNKSGLTMSVPEDFAAVELKNLSAAVPNAIVERTNLTILLVAVSSSGMSRIAVTEMNLNSTMTADDVIEMLNNISNTQGAQVRTLSKTQAGDSVITEREYSKGETMRSKEKFFFVRTQAPTMKVFEISFLTTPEIYERYGLVIDKIIESARLR